MIRTVTVYTGESDYAKAAQQHAIEMAKLFSARLKVVRIWDAEKAAPMGEPPESAAELVKRNQEDIVETAERAGVRVVKGLRGDGMTRGLLEEARETDLLVLGLPTEAESDKDDAAPRLIKTERPVLRKADCALLVVNRPPSAVNKILARYQEGMAGKAMLRMTGAVAERYHARLRVVTIENDLAKAAELAAAAEEYLKGYDLAAVETRPQSGPTDSKVKILHAAESFGADLIAMGEEGHHWLERALGADLAERTALSTSTPLLIVR